MYLNDIYYWIEHTKQFTTTMEKETVTYSMMLIKFEFNCQFAHNVIRQVLIFYSSIED